MAQKTEKEETEFKSVPEPITPCITNCGVSGNPATNNMCHNCFTKLSPSLPPPSSSPRSSSPVVLLPEPPTEKRNHLAINDEEGNEIFPSNIRLSPSSVRSPVSSSPRSSPVIQLPEPPTEKRNEIFTKKRAVNRCSGCSKKVGLTGIRCRCGELFCAGHRYSDRHDCSYDYKGAGREAIARENPVVKAAKIVKI